LFQFPGHLPKTSAGPQSNHYYSEESGNRLIQSHDPGQMNKEQTAAALQLLALLEGDEIADANASIYGRWHEHLADQLSDEHIDDLGLLEPLVVDLVTR
jgi:hypothetical protein